MRRLPGLPGGDDRVLLLDQSARRQRRAQLRRAARQPALLSDAPDAGGAAATTCSRSTNNVGFNPQMQRAQSDVRQGRCGRRAERRLPRPRSLALPFDRDLANGRARSLRAYRLARPLSRRRAICPRTIFSTASRSRRCCPKCWSRIKVDVPSIASLNGYGLLSDRNAVSKRTYTELVSDNQLPVRIAVSRARRRDRRSRAARLGGVAQTRRRL